MALGSFANKGGYNVDPDFVKRWKRAQGGITRGQAQPKPKPSQVFGKPVAAPPAPAVNPVAQTAAVQATTGSKLVDDAQAAAARAQGIFDVTQRTNALQQAGAYDATDLAEAIRRLNTQRPEDERNAKNAANAAGLASSSTSVQQLGDIARAYTRQQGDLEDRYARAEAERAQQIADLEAQRALNETAIDQALSERQYGRDQEAALLNALAGPKTAVSGQAGGITRGGGGPAAGGITRSSPAPVKPSEVFGKPVKKKPKKGKG